jgi:putative ABC transport system permease protein
MNALKIAWRSIQHRGLGSILTILSMALGVMLVVGVLTVHGIVSQSFKSNSNFAYDLIVGPSGSAMQVTMNTVFYLSKPVENIPYEYYLALSGQPLRERQLRDSIAWQTKLLRAEADKANDMLLAAGTPVGGPGLLARQAMQGARRTIEEERIGLKKAGSQSHLVEFVIPVNLGDYLDRFRVVGTTSSFFEHIVLDQETDKRFTFSEGRPLRDFDETNQWYEAVLGAKVAAELNLKVGDRFKPIHGDPNDGGHTHEQTFVVVGVLDYTGTPHDRAAFANIEGFYLLDGHIKPVDEQLLSEMAALAEEETNEAEIEGFIPQASIEKLASSRVLPPLPVEQREVTALLVRSASSSEEDEGEEEEFMEIGSGYVLQTSINSQSLLKELDWSDFRPRLAKAEAQAVNPVMEVTLLFDSFVNPIRWILLVLTTMICVVSAISILVGIYSSMSQRRHEIAVIRALGASRGKVMLITLLEAITLAVLGGMLGWVAGHGLNALASPLIESRTGVSIGFRDFAPGVPILSYLGFSGVSGEGGDGLEWFRVSTELFLIPGLILLAVLVGMYPAISAYRTDVAKSLK